MSATQDEDERRKRSLEAGREMLEKYKVKRSSKDKSGNMEYVEQSDDESLHNEKSMLHKESGIIEAISSRDITHSSVSISEGEADADLEGLAGRVAELEELLQGKEAIVGALNAEIDHLRAETSSPNSSQSRGSSIHGRDIISLYHIKLQEFEKAVNQRDTLIEHLTSSLEQALSARDSVTAQLNTLNSIQLNNPTIDNVNLQQKIKALEITMSDQEGIIRRLNAHLTDIRKHVQTLEMERETQNAEINDYKVQINNLNEQIRLSAAEKNLNIDETLEQQKQYEARVDKIKQDMQHILNKFTTVTNANAIRHQQELKELTLKYENEITNIKAKHEEYMKVLKNENKMIADRLNKELPDLESRHAKELSVFQTQLCHYKKTVEALKLELVNHAESQKIAQSEVHLYKVKLDELKFEAENERRMQNLHFQKEKELLNEQIKLHKIQLEEMTSKHITSMSILESKESIERSLEQALSNAAALKQENDTLKFKLDDLSCRYSTAQSIIENSQVHDRTLSGRLYIGDLEKSLSRLDATSVSTVSELGETMYKTFDEEAIQHQLTKRKLEEKMEIEQLLVEKVSVLETDLVKANNKLEEADIAKKTYEKQLKDMKNACDKLQQEVISLREFSHVTSSDASIQNSSKNVLVNIESDSAWQIEKQQREIESLKLLLEEKETENARYRKDLIETTEKTKQMEMQCQQLTNGLAHAWAQCAEFEERLNQTLGLSDSSKMNISLNSTISSKHLKENQNLDDNILNQSTASQKKILELNIADTLIDTNNYLKNNENLYEELQQILENKPNLDEVKLKLSRYYALCEKIVITKAQSSRENVTLPQNSENSLQRSLENLWTEKEKLSQEIEELMNRRKAELESVKTDSAKEISRLRSLLQNFKDGNASLNDLRTELEARHTKEMEELRTYFEQKCLQMEKQYSEEVFSQQSKRISDNDSETEELTDDLYFGGAGDCLNVSNSRAATPSAIEESLRSKILDAENQARLETEYEGSIQALQKELELKVNEIQNVKADYEKTLKQQKELYECQIHDIEAKLKHTLIVSTVHQIEAADKQLRATRRFLDEQASEREMERDEAAKQIRFLQEQLKERERDKERDMRITSEQSELSSERTDIPELQMTDINAAVEALESQMREMSSLMSDTEAKKSEKESELKAAVDKIWVLRDIIADLEQQLQAKIEREESLQMQINQLETVITAQTKNQQELVQELDAIKSGSENRHLNEQINHLQEELNKHKLSSEHFNVNSSVLKQMKAELHEMQNQLDKRIREMESAHMCGSNLSLSQPSEDVSIREQIDATRCLTPDDPSSPPMLPLDQVLKLKDKMLKHARAEEVAFKRIKDLEMQLTTMKNQNEELLTEQEILHQTASEQLFQIETMRGRLEQHKQSAPFAQKQATSRLELQLHEATTKYHSLEQTITDKEIELKELKAQLERTNQMLAEKEAEMENFVQSENGALQKIERLKDQLKLVQEEKKMLQIKLGTQEHTQLELPQLIDTILADKNEEIDHLKEQLSKREKQLNVYSSLALDDVQLRELTKQAEAKNSARTLSDILSIHSECEEFPEATRAPNMTLTTSHNVSSFKVPTSSSKNTLQMNSLNTLETPLLDVDKIDTQVPPLDLHSNTHSYSNGNVSHSGMELHRSGEESKLSSPKNNDIIEDSQRAEELFNEKVKEIENLSNQLQVLQHELDLKSDFLNKYEMELFTLQKQYQNLQDEFKETVENLVRDKNFYRGQYELAQASESKIKKDLEEVENILKLKSDELEDQNDRMQVNERIITELNAENTKLKREIEDREKDQMKRNNSLQDMTQELQRFKELVLDKDIALETLQTRNIEIENENKQLYEFKTKVHAREQEIAELQDEILRLTDGLNNRDQVIRKLEEMARRMSDVQSGTSSPSSSNKDQEIHHLQEFLKEKDKVIRQMSDDSKSLHRALETIQNKMKESGNIVELRRKLKEERRLNEELRDMMLSLQKELELKNASVRRSQDDSDIEDMVQRELNLSARLDKQIMQVIKDDEVVDGVVMEDYQQRNNEVRKDNESLKKLKDDLEVERDIMRHQIAEYEDRILQLKADLTEEMKKVVKLDKEFLSERDVVKFLRMEIEEHRRMAEVGRIQDTELIEFLQTKLKASLDNEEKLRNDLASMRQQQINLDSQLMSMRKSIEIENISRNLSNFAATAQNESERTSGNLEESRKHNAQLKENIKKLENEMSKYEKRLEIATEEQERLISSLALTNGLKEILEADLRRTAEELKAREEHCNYLQEQVKMLTENMKHGQRNAEFDEIKELRREINDAREIRIELETDINRARQELKESSNRELKLTRTVDSLKERETELNMRLAISKEKERKFKDLIENTKDVPTNFMQKIKELSETVEKYAIENSNLDDKIGRMRTDRELSMQRVKLLEGQLKKLKNTHASSQQTIPIERLQNFYGKYLRVESRRKALAYQKKYLLCIVGSYQYCEENTLCVLAQLTQDQRSYARLSRNRKVRFRIAVFAIISIHRMKWLIQRWRTGKRVGANAIMGSVDQLIDLPPVRKTPSNHSPPVRERATNGGSSFMLGQYYQDVRNFQETFGAVMAESGTSHIISE
ncbi:PREDICTED: trichohyalin-like isoform X5 [Atta colombica]|uniref:trichohyalin-like isoform X5 n=1 Tax=Atta colombica TaxID=520822 RepID=UPI00084C0859|nr:PREDICTED: trichohyalin-like isoform X5 [Atta colombica]